MAAAGPSKVLNGFRYTVQGTGGVLHYNGDLLPDGQPHGQKPKEAARCPNSLGTDGLTMCVGIYFHISDNLCYVAHADNHTRFIKPDLKDPVSIKVQEWALTKIPPEVIKLDPEHKRMCYQSLIIMGGNGDPGYRMAIDHAISTALGGVAKGLPTGQELKPASGFIIPVDNDLQPGEPIWLGITVRLDKVGWKAHEEEGSVKWSFGA